jgi:hypothetical protein
VRLSAVTAPWLVTVSEVLPVAVTHCHQYLTGPFLWAAPAHQRHYLVAKLRRVGCRAFGKRTLL